MTYREPARTTRRTPRIVVVGLLVVLALIAAVLGYPLLASSSSAIDARRVDLDHRAGGGGAGAPLGQGVASGAPAPAGLASLGRAGRAQPGPSHAQRPP